MKDYYYIPIPDRSLVPAVPAIRLTFWPNSGGWNTRGHVNKAIKSPRNAACDILFFLITHHATDDRFIYGTRFLYTVLYICMYIMYCDTAGRGCAV